MPSLAAPCGGLILGSSGVGKGRALPGSIISIGLRRCKNPPGHYTGAGAQGPGARSHMALYHFSENPDLTVFQPHVSKTSTIRDEALVWAIDDWHSPMYYVPRDCPRACFWAGPQTTAEDRLRWLHELEPRLVMVVESSWLERIRRARVYRYTMPEATFSPAAHGAGHHVSREPVQRLRVEPMGDLIAAILEASVELRFTPRLGAMWKQIWQGSSLVFSGTRLRNAAGYPAEFGVAEET